MKIEKNKSNARVIEVNLTKCTDEQVNEAFIDISKILSGNGKKYKSEAVKKALKDSKMGGNNNVR